MNAKANTLAVSSPLAVTVTLGTPVALSIVAVGVPKPAAAPVAPVAPLGPCGPISPLAPAAPAGPISPVSPFGPAGPTGPCSPCGPVEPFDPFFTVKVAVSPSAFVNVNTLEPPSAEEVVVCSPPTR